MLGQLESLVRWGSNLLEQQQQTPGMQDQRPLPTLATTPSTQTRRTTTRTRTGTETMSASPPGVNDTNNITNTDDGDEDAHGDEDDGLGGNFGDAADVDHTGGHDMTINTSTSVDTPGLFAASLTSLPSISSLPTISEIPTISGFLFGGQEHDSTPASAPVHQTQLPPVHLSNTSCSPEMMDHDGDNTNDNNGKKDEDDEMDEEDEGEPLTIPVGHLTPTGSLFALEPIKKLIGEYPEDYFFQIEGLRTYRPGNRRARGTSGNSLRDDLDSLFLGKAYTDLLLTAFFTHVQPHFPIVCADVFMPFVDRVLGLAWMDDPAKNQDDAEIDVALCLTVLALGRLVYRQDQSQDRQSTNCVSPSSRSAAGTSVPNGEDTDAATASPADASTEDSEAYFNIAYGIMMRHWATCFKPSVTFASALVYAAIYLCYLDRPLPAWSLVHMASIKLQVIVVQLKGQPVTREETDHVVRLCWTCFLLECDSLAEFHLPRSGMELIIESMPFPSFAHSGSGDAEPNSGRSGLMFLALCSVRRLLNRVHKTVYDANYKARSTSKNRTPRSKTDVSSMSMPISLWTPSSPADAAVDNIFNAINMNTIRSPSVSVSIPTSIPHPSSSSPASSTTLSAIGSLKAVSTELISQLDTWFESLPPSIKPDLSHRRPQCLQEGWLRLRYWSAKHIICRPCLVFAALYTGEPAALPDYVLWFSQTCIESCRQYIQTVEYMLVERTQYMWMTRQSLLACAFVITIAARSPLLRFLVAHDASTLIRQALVSTQRWATPGSTAESIGWILNMILQKERMTGGIMGTIKGN
ncbi:hypothetical protein Sste5346_008839 [Sporothrix stenoceras]|uniref:Transcription factor domain-containing protein n=1 Tax=Sporothrix stenoceras TaxID=5173 RepID=A0ABR3YNY9_9PEZI